MNSEKNIDQIIRFLEKKRGFDFKGASATMIRRRILKRVGNTKSGDFSGYFNFIKSNPEELDNLVDVLTIGVSNFFRDADCFNFLSKKVLAPLIATKRSNNEGSLRIWSAGCSTGEEAYSLAIAVDDIIKKKESKPDYYVFATDIDRKALEHSKKGIYDEADLDEVSFKMVREYFTSLKGNKYRVIPEIKKNVYFSFFDLLDKNTSSPRESIFGAFDIILCRNVLIYYNPDYQERILKKLMVSLNQGGKLLIGRSENLPPGLKKHFKIDNADCKLFTKKETK